jgi:hypothetical protein
MAACLPTFRSRVHPDTLKCLHREFGSLAANRSNHGNHTNTANGEKRDKLAHRVRHAGYVINCAFSDHDRTSSSTCSTRARHAETPNNTWPASSPPPTTSPRNHSPSMMQTRQSNNGSFRGRASTWASSISLLKLLLPHPPSPNTYSKRRRSN